ncbi:hypothetical protein AKJ16_DCAP17346 [Drosera capensis]
MQATCREKKQQRSNEVTRRRSELESVDRTYEGIQCPTIGEAFGCAQWNRVSKSLASTEENTRNWVPRPPLLHRLGTPFHSASSLLHRPSLPSPPPPSSPLRQNLPFQIRRRVVASRICDLVVDC